MQLRSKITSKGQVTIPREVRRALRLEQGDSILFRVQGGRAYIEPSGSAMSFAEDEGMWREGRGLSWDEINAQVREMRGDID